ncbi:MAG TPA: alpha-hydroxy-acid oxidizing protein [Candidatus Acidoferrales bacterium]|nr:alpha-hydroxy-acid oxidizing protein [Candidatus Acidoferrales bacterium]
MDRTRRDFLSATAAAVTLSTTLPALASSDPQTATSSAYAAPTEIKAIDIINLRELEPAAQKVIPAGGFGYISSAAGDEWTKRENEAAFKRLTIVPRYLTGYKDADRSTTLLGSKVSMPIIVSAMAGHGMAHVTAEVGSSKGTGEAGALYTAASLSTKTMEEIAVASSGPKWFQIYLPADRGQAREILIRAKTAGYRAIILTIDTVVPSNRETDRRNHFRSPLPVGNFPGESGAYAAAPIKRDLDWEDVEFIWKTTGLPVLLKGVMSPELAVTAVERGCAGVQVSNHGGRQLDDVAASITVLPRIADAVRGRATIIIDGGVRRGQDVFKALALGAHAVAVGRPILYGLALGGWLGVQAVLQHLDGEFEMTMRLAGVRTIAEISSSYVAVGPETLATI